MKWTVGAKIGAGFGLTLAMLLIIGAVSYRSTIKLVETAKWVAHTYAVLADLEDVLSLLKDAETGQRGFLITGQQRYLEPYNAASDAMEKKIRELRDLTKDNPDQQRRLDDLAPLLKAKFTELQQTITLRRSQGFDAALRVVLTDKGKKAMDDIRAVVGDMEGAERDLLKKRSAEEATMVQNTKLIIVAGTAIAFLLVSFAAFAITRNIAAPLRQISGVAEKIAEGDLAMNISTNHRADEVGVLSQTFTRMTHSLQEMAGVAEQIAVGDLRVQVKPQSGQDMLGNAFASMIANLQRMIADLTEATSVLSASAGEISASTTQLAASATETATAVTETTTTVEEIRQTAQVSTQKARQVSETAQRTLQISQSGKKATAETSLGMQRIREQMEAIAEGMVRLSEQSQAIGAIIATVDDLAQQSNLLAVNASIEAAKAGEQGKGFAVVAQEVKSLADQSKQATMQVRTILSDIQKATSAAVMATEQGSKAVEVGLAQSSQAGEAIGTLAQSVEEAAEAATQIAASSQQQLVGMDQVVLAMESIKQASGQNVEGAKQLEESARNLTELGQRLKQQVEQYKV